MERDRCNRWVSTFGIAGQGIYARYSNSVWNCTMEPRAVRPIHDIKSRRLCLDDFEVPTDNKKAELPIFYALAPMLGTQSERSVGVCWNPGSK